jgi:cytochrome c553
MIAFTSVAYPQKHWDAPQVVTTYCSGCHGVDGNTGLPYFPKLAGLQIDYTAKKLSAFKEPASPPVDELFWWFRKRPANVTRDEQINMEGVAHSADSETIKQALVWYAQQSPSKGHSANKTLVVQGEDIFTKGIPAQKTLACMTCHGPAAEGKGIAPRLAGQNAEYIESQLNKFRSGDRSHAPEMTLVTRDLDPNQAHQVAAYLQSR